MTRDAVNEFNRAYRKHYGPKRRLPVWTVIFLVVVAALVAIYAVR